MKRNIHRSVRANSGWISGDWSRSLADDDCWISRNDHRWRNIMSHNSTGADDRIVANRHSRTNECIGTDPHSAANLACWSQQWEIRFGVVVRAITNVNALRNHCVFTNTERSQVVHQHPIRETTVLAHGEYPRMPDFRGRSDVYRPCNVRTKCPKNAHSKLPHRAGTEANEWRTDDCPCQFSRIFSPGVWRSTRRMELLKNVFVRHESTIVSTFH